MLITAAVFALTLVEPVCEPHLRICATAETHAFDVCTEPAVLVAEFGPSADQATRSQPAAPDQDKNEKQRDSQKGEAKKSEEKPPTPEHTGLETLVTDILSDFKAFPRRESTWVILGVGGAAALAVHPADRSVNSHLLSSGSADKLWKPGHIIGGPIMYGVPVALYLGGRYLLAPAKDEPQTNKWSHLGLDLIRAELEEEAIVQTLKFSVRRTRPNGTPYSFPSGHAAATFALAAVLERHLGYRLAWPTLAIATYVATSRLHDNVHYLSDVIFGAAIGTATGWTVVGRHGRSSYAFAPTPVPGGLALMVTRNDF